MRHTACCRASLLGLLTLLMFVALLPALAEAAVTKVICVPWQGDVSKYHTTWDGQSVYLKGVVHTDSTAMIWYRWNFGDGTQSAIMSTSGRTKYNIEITHAYSGSVGTPFTAMLAVADNSAMANAVEDPYLVKIEDANLDSKINLAIDNGLWYLYKNGIESHSYMHTFDGSAYMAWSYSSYYSSPTASAIHAFQINGHKETGDPDQDPYVTAVERGFNWLFNGYYYNTGYQMTRPLAIGPQEAGDPDSNGNGIGIEARDYGNSPVYETGMLMGAIIASGTPDALTGRDYDGDGIIDSYGKVLQDMVDMYAFGQNDPSRGGYSGGWRYGWNYGSSDNSISQWAAIGIVPAEEPPWNCAVPQWVKDLNNNTWLNYSHNIWTSGGVEYGGFGYTNPSPTWGYYAVTPSGMTQLSFSGSTTADPRWIRSERWLADEWNDWLGQNNMYAYFALAKAMRTAKPSPVVNFSSNNFDWYRGSGVAMGLAQKIADRLVASSYWDYYGPNLGTAWGIIILKPVLFAESPIACFDADPNPNYPDMPINFDPSCSDHSAPGKDISNLTLFEWDWDNDGVYDHATASAEEVAHSFSCPSIPCIYPVKLKVFDDSDPAGTATYVMNIEISNPPHPPVADAGGNYWASLCQDETLSLDGSGSYDPDAGSHEAGCSTCPDDQITAWDWDLTGAPFDYADASGEVLDLGAGFTAYFSSADSYDIGLRVTDNTEAAYPGSGQGDLTDEDFTQLEVFDGCICTVTAEPLCQAVAMSWDDIGADRYDIYRSFIGPNEGFQYIGFTTENSKTAGSFVMEKTHWYRIMAVTGEQRCLSRAVEVYGNGELCNPVADAGGPYEVCVDQEMTLDGSASYPLSGVIVTWEWDLDNDGDYDDAFGEQVTHTWSNTGSYSVGLEIVSSDSLVLTDTDTATVNVVDCSQGCVDDLYARAKYNKVQLVWTDTGADQYNVYRSTTSGGPYSLIATTTSDYSTYLDEGLAYGTTYYYIVREATANEELCQSNEASATPTLRVRR